VKDAIWRAVGRWLLVPPAFLFGLVLGYIFLNLSFLFEQACIRWTRTLTLSPSSLLEFLGLACFIFALAICTTPIAWTAGFALRTKQAPRFEWGLTLALLLGAAYVWTKPYSGSATFTHLAAGSGVAILVGGIILSFRVNHSVRTHFVANALALMMLMLPYVVALARTPKLPPAAQRVWSTVLAKGTWQAMNTGSSYAATRQVAFARDKVVAIFDAGYPTYQGKQPMSKYRLLSLDAGTGEIKDSREIVGRWGDMPYLFATDDGHILLDDRGTLKALNPDLTETGPHFTLDHGRVGRISTDGSTLGWETGPGTTLLDSHTLLPVGKHLAESVPASVSRTAVLTSNTYWYRDYPKDHAFVGITDEHGQRLLFHGECGRNPTFVNNETVLVFGCGRMWTLNLDGTILREAATPGRRSTLAGISQNGQRFALQFSDEKGDPSILLYEYFIIFDVATLKPLTTVRISDMPEHQSWSAFSPDGRHFVTGNPDNLSLYQLQ